MRTRMLTPPPADNRPRVPARNARVRAAVSARAARPPVASRAVAAGTSLAEEGQLEFPALPPHRGGRLEPACIAWRLSGAAGAPVVSGLGGISAHRRVYDTVDPSRGWWSALAGPGLPLDTIRFRVLYLDWLSGNGGGTGTLARRDDFTPIDTCDQARALLPEPPVYRYLGGLQATLPLARHHSEYAKGPGEPGAFPFLADQARFPGRLRAR